MIVAALPALLLTVTPGQQVLIVDDDAGPGVVTDSIQTAIDLAQNGDVILVRPGRYSPFVLRDKSLTIQGDGPGVHVEAPVEIDGPIPGDVVLDGLDIRIADQSPLFLLKARTVAGTLWLEDLRVWNDTWQQGFYGFGSTAVSIDSCPDVVVTDCVFASGTTVFSSSVARLFETEMDAAPVAPSASSFISTGLQVQGGSDLTAVGCTIRGADGKDAPFNPELTCDFTQPGGDGVVVAFNSTATLIETAVTAGQGGVSEWECSPDSPDGEIYNVWSDSELFLIDLHWPARRLDMTDPLSSGTTGTLTLEGAPTELAWIFASTPSVTTTLPIFTGPLCVSPAAPALFLGAIGSDGTLQVPVTVTLPTSAGLFDLRLQPLLYSLEDSFVLGTPRSPLVLGA